MEGFEYVVNPPEIPKIAFGTSLDRETMPMKGPNLSSFMKRKQGEVSEFPGPFEYDTFKPLGFKYPSSAGFSAFASKAPRLHTMREAANPPIGSYEIGKWKHTDKSAFRFGKSKARDVHPKWITPGPSSYPVHISYSSFKLNQCFGSKRIIWPAVAVCCAPSNTSQCYKCGKNPLLGDYYHNFHTSQDICRLCLNYQIKITKNCNLELVERIRMRREILQFVPTRYCGFFHQHNGTNAAVELTSRKDLRNKTKIENYLYRFQAKNNLHSAPKRFIQFVKTTTKTSEHVQT